MGLLWELVTPDKGELFMLNEIDAVIDAQIRPQLALHGGDIRVLSFEDGIVRFEFLGHCSGCPSASLTTEELVRATLTEALPQIKDVILVERIDQALLNQARAILSRPRLE